ncbi:MAG: hypothetical protein KC425_13400, partial [Anaerolineales bacterium]|nr:hypothetical protein [Anaerolineales bacterium]
GETAVPAEVLARLAALSPPRLRAWAAETELADVFERADGDEAWFEARLSRLLVRSRREQLRVAARLAFPPRWHFRLQAWPRLQASPAWPLVYVVLNGQRVGRILAKGWARAAVGREIGD